MSKSLLPKTTTSGETLLELIAAHASAQAKQGADPCDHNLLSFAETAGVVAAHAKKLGDFYEGRSRAAFEAAGVAEDWMDDARAADHERYALAMRVERAKKEFEKAKAALENHPIGD